MALKVVPAGDERCDVHNRREPQKYICETCLKEFGIESAPPAATRRARVRRAIRRSRVDRRVLIGGGVVGLLIAGVVVVIVLAAGGSAGKGHRLAAPDGL